MSNEAFLKFAEVLHGSINFPGVNANRVIYNGTTETEVGRHTTYQSSFILNENIQSQYTGVSLSNDLSFTSGDYSAQTSTTYVARVEFGTGDPELQLDFGAMLVQLNFTDAGGEPAIQEYQIYTLSSLDIYFTEGA